MEENTKPKLIQMLFGPETLDQINDLGLSYRTVDSKGKVNRTITLRAIIAKAHKKEFPEYLQTIKNRPSPLEKEVSKLDAQETRERLKEEKELSTLTGICHLLDESEITVHPESGKPSCQYPKYTMSSPHRVSRTLVVEELRTLNAETPSLQYQDIMGHFGDVGKENVLRVLRKQNNEQSS